MPDCIGNQYGKSNHYSNLPLFFKKNYTIEGNNTHTDSDIIQKIVEWLPRPEHVTFVLSSSKEEFEVPNN